MTAVSPETRLTFQVQPVHVPSLCGSLVPLPIGTNQRRGQQKCSCEMSHWKAGTLWEGFHHPDKVTTGLDVMATDNQAEALQGEKH